MDCYLLVIIINNTIVLRVVSYKVLYENSVLVGFSFLSVVIVLLVQGRFNDLIRIYFTAVWKELVLVWAKFIISRAVLLLRLFKTFVIGQR